MEGYPGSGRRHRKVLNFSSDENQLKVLNLSDAVKKPATYLMLLWPGMMVVFTLSLKSESEEVFIVPTNMGDALASLLNNDHMRSAQICKWLPKARVDPEEAVLTVF